MNTHRIDFRRKAWEQSGPSVRMKLHREGDTQVRLVEFSKGFVETGWCRKGHVGYVLNGRLKVSFSGRMEVFQAGDGVFIPAGKNHQHKAHVLTDTATLILIE